MKQKSLSTDQYLLLSKVLHSYAVEFANFERMAEMNIDLNSLIRDLDDFILGSLNANRKEHSVEHYSEEEDDDEDVLDEEEDDNDDEADDDDEDEDEEEEGTPTTDPQFHHTISSSLLNNFDNFDLDDESKSAEFAYFSYSKGAKAESLDFWVNGVSQVTHVHFLKREKNVLHLWWKRGNSTFVSEFTLGANYKETQLYSSLKNKRGYKVVFSDE